MLLSLALYFRTAINQIVISFYSERRERKEKQRKILSELNERMFAFPVQYLSTILGMSVLVENLRGQLRPEQVAMAEKLQKADAVQDTVNFLLRHSADFPQQIRVLIDELHENMVLRSREQEVILERSEAVKAIANRIREEIRLVLK